MFFGGFFLSALLACLIIVLTDSLLPECIYWNRLLLLQACRKGNTPAEPHTHTHTLVLCAVEHPWNMNNVLNRA